MAYKNIDGINLKKMILGGGQCLSINKDLIDSLNVFPVPDGDTGTNMTMTYMTAINEINGIKDEDINIENISKAFQKGAMKGARGNSGVILSQIIKGMCEVFKDLDEITTKDFSKALKRGTDIAYSAVTKPKEGTILTVIRVIAENSVRASLKTDILEFLSKMIVKGEEILKLTTDMLPVLKKAGTVDAGGKGVVEIIRGMYNALAGIEMESLAESISAPVNAPDSFQMPDYEGLDEIEFGYCTEFVIINFKETATMADIDKLRDKLMGMGDSVICIGDLSLVKVHVHTNTPGNAIQQAIKIGEVDKIKIENMREQNRQLIAHREANKVPLSMISICNGEGIKRIFTDLGVENIIDGGQTMNPSVDDILSMIKRANAKEVIIFPNNKNIILAAEQAKAITECNVHIVPTTNVIQGIRAAMMFDAFSSGEINYDIMCGEFDKVQYGEITHAIKSTTIDNLSIKSGDIIGLDGSTIVTKDNNINSALVNLLGIMNAASKDIITLFYGNGLSEEDAQAAVNVVSEKFPNSEVSYQLGGQQHYFYFVSLE